MTEAVPIKELAALVGLPLDAYRAEHVSRQLERALARESAASWHSLVARIREDKDSRSRLRRAVAVSVTGRFRDVEQFNLLEETFLPELAHRFERLRVWSAGCSDGSEVLSLAIVLERLGVLDRSFLIGSDILAENIAAGRALVAAELPEAHRRVRFEIRDLLDGGPAPGRFALVVCRNLGIYLCPEAKARLHQLLVQALSIGGILLLGRSERLPRPEALGLEPAGAHAYRLVNR